MQHLFLSSWWSLACSLFKGATVPLSGPPQVTSFEAQWRPLVSSRYVVFGTSLLPQETCLGMGGLGDYPPPTFKNQEHSFQLLPPRAAKISTRLVVVFLSRDRAPNGSQWLLETMWDQSNTSLFRILLFPFTSSSPPNTTVCLTKLTSIPLALLGEEHIAPALKGVCFGVLLATQNAHSL